MLLMEEVEEFLPLLLNYLLAFNTLCNLNNLKDFVVFMAYFFVTQLPYWSSN